MFEENVEPFGGLIARSRGGALDTSDVSIAGSENRAIGGQWLNEARVQWARQDSILMALDPRCGGPCTNPDQGGPSVEISGVAVVGRHRLTPNARTPVRLQVVDSISRVGARHHVKAGIEFNRINSDFSLPFQFGGRYVFTSMAAVLAGRLRTGLREPTLSYVYRDLSAFVQHEWRVSNRLTVAAGLRYQTQFWPDLRFDVSSLNGTRLRYAMPQGRNDLAPRVSVSFRPASSGALVIPSAVLTPASLDRGILLTIDGLTLLLLWLNHLGWTRLAGVLLVVALLARVSYSTIDQGGIQSPGSVTYVIFPLMAGVLLGTLAGYLTATVCVVLVFVFVVLEAHGGLPDQRITYSSGSLGIVRLTFRDHQLSRIPWRSRPCSSIGGRSPARDSQPWQVLVSAPSARATDADIGAGLLPAAVRHDRVQRGVRLNLPARQRPHQRLCGDHRPPQERIWSGPSLGYAGW